jgi:hypothetical protein
LIPVERSQVACWLYDEAGRARLKAAGDD